MTLYIPEKATNWNHWIMSPKLGECADPELGPAEAPPVAPREPMEAIPVIIMAAPAIPTVARVTEVCEVDFPFSICEVRHEIGTPF